jgi:hypothetical protein
MANSIFGFFRALFGKSASAASESEAKPNKPHREHVEMGASEKDKPEGKAKSGSASRNGKKQKKSKQKQRPMVVSQSPAKSASKQVFKSAEPIATASVRAIPSLNRVVDNPSVNSPPVNSQLVNSPSIERPQVEPIFEPMRNLRTLRQAVSIRSNPSKPQEIGTDGTYLSNGEKGPIKPPVIKSQVTRLERKNVLPDKVRTYEGFEAPVLQVPQLPKRANASNAGQALGSDPTLNTDQESQVVPAKESGTVSAEAKSIARGLSSFVAKKRAERLK